MKIAIQGELGSNSHMAAAEMLGNQTGLEIIACTVSAQVMAKVVAGEVDGAVLPIENSLHGLGCGALRSAAGAAGAD
ncbi:MAG: prephenate dehydratase domain-containing protein [Edaphobacter sp.]